MPGFRILEITSLPDGIHPLAEEARSEGHEFVIRLIQSWLSAENQFNRRGEVLYAVTFENNLVGVGGLNLDPYAENPLVGRVRHLYISKKYRRQGAARALVEEIIHKAKETFSVLRLRTSSPEADLFYCSLGFEAQTEQKECTHILRLNREP